MGHRKFVICCPLKWLDKEVYRLWQENHCQTCNNWRHILISFSAVVLTDPGNARPVSFCISFQRIMPHCVKPFFFASYFASIKMWPCLNLAIWATCFGPQKIWNWLSSEIIGQEEKGSPFMTKKHLTCNNWRHILISFWKWIKTKRDACS